MISRFKFKSNFLFDEYHYDIGAIKPDMECYGTVRPLKELYAVDEMDDVKKLKFLNDKLKELKEQIHEHFPDITANFDFVDGSWHKKQL